MWGDEIRKHSSGQGVPTVRRLSWTAYTSGEPEEHGMSWDVTYPDPSKACGFECCGMTESRMFDTWREALTFALSRNWEG